MCSNCNKDEGKTITTETWKKDTTGIRDYAVLPSAKLSKSLSPWSETVITLR